MQNIHRYKIIEELSKNEGAELFNASPSGSDVIWTLLKWTPAVQATTDSKFEFARATKGWAEEGVDPFIYQGNLCLASQNRALLESKAALLRTRGILGQETEAVLQDPELTARPRFSESPMLQPEPVRSPTPSTIGVEEVPPLAAVESIASFQLAAASELRPAAEPAQIKPDEIEVLPAAQPPVSKGLRRKWFLLIGAGAIVVGGGLFLYRSTSTQPTTTQPEVNSSPPKIRLLEKYVSRPDTGDQAGTPQPAAEKPRSQPDGELSQGAVHMAVGEGPQISSFTAAPQSVGLHSSFTLAWKVADAQEVQIQLDERPRTSKFEFSHASREPSGLVRIDTDPALFSAYGTYVFRLTAKAANGKVKQANVKLNLVKGRRSR